MRSYLLTLTSTLVLASCSSVYQKADAVNPSQAEQKATIQPEMQSRELGPGLRLSTHKRKEDSQQLGYDLIVNLPRLEGSNRIKIEKFNRQVSDFVRPEIDTFRKYAEEDLREPGAREAIAKKERPGYMIEIDHHVTAAGRSFVSILFSIYSFTGGAHPNTQTRAFNYDLRNDDLIDLASLFKTNSGYLESISSYCMAQLNERQVGDQDWIKKGAGPDPENYKTWNITPDGLQVTFDAYQVASYAEGPQTVVVPYKILKSTIRPRGILDSFLKQQTRQKK